MRGSSTRRCCLLLGIAAAAGASRTFFAIVGLQVWKMRRRGRRLKAQKGVAAELTTMGGSAGREPLMY